MAYFPFVCGACASISELKSCRAVPEVWSESETLKVEME